ncbi:lytic murein transglycosylase [Palleronia caenipelagi]|nr:lytic murein transglycosylase [Palleronia caenipelagi]
MRSVLLSIIVWSIGSGVIAQAQEPGRVEIDADVAATAVPQPQTTDVETTSEDDAVLERWLSAFRGRALAQGVDRAVFDAEMASVTYVPLKPPRLDKPIWEVIDDALTSGRIGAGRWQLQRRSRMFGDVEAQYGVDRHLLAAIWGLQSDLGTTRTGPRSVDVLASRAASGPARAYHEAQLVALLMLHSTGALAPEDARGSASGGLGPMNMRPTDLVLWAQDVDGDGRVQLAGRSPVDAMGNVAAMLRAQGVRPGVPWGQEVRLPDGFDYDLAGGRARRAVAEWRDDGVTGAGGADLRSELGLTRLLLPAGALGPAFIVSGTFDALAASEGGIQGALAIGLLADRLAGGAELVAAWPRDERTLTTTESAELQRRLTEAGFDTGGVDGKLGPRSLAAVRAYQTDAALPADGFPSLALLQRLRDEAPAEPVEETSE